MANKYFYALTLKGAKTSECWDPEDYFGGQELVIRQALLGPEAKEGEVNVVEVEAMMWKDSITIPVAALTAGPNGTSQCLLDLSFIVPPVTFSLLKGSGPVHIIGHQLIDEFAEMEEEMSDEDEEVLDEEEGEKAGDDEEEDEKGPKKKAKTATNSKGKAPVVKNEKK